jgi:hypothetical protein
LKEHWSARKIEEHMASGRSGEQKQNRKATPVRPLQHDLLTKTLGARVTTQQTAKGSGRIVIEFKDEDERQRIEKIIGS